MKDFYLYLAVYIVVLLAISFFVARKESAEDFLISGRDRTTWTILMSKFANSIGVNWFVVYTAYAYQFGLGIYGILLGFVFGYLFFAYWAAPKIFKNSKKEKFYTQGDFVFNRTGSDFAKILTNIVAIIIQFSWLIIAVVGGSKIISSVGVISYEIAMLITVLIVMIYVLIAGFKAVLITDIFQGIIIIILLVLVTVGIVGDISIHEIISIRTGALDLPTAFGIFLYGALSVFALSDRYQLSYSAKDEKSLKRGMAFPIIPILIVASFLLLIGLYMYRQDPNLDPALVFIEALKAYLPASLLPIGVVLFFAGLMSNSDTSIYAISSHYVFSKKKNNPVRDIRISTFVIMTVICVIAYFCRDIVDITVVAASITIVLAVPMIYLITGKGNPNRFSGSVFGGIIGLILGILIIGIEPAIILLVVLGGLLGLFYKWSVK